MTIEARIQLLAGTFTTTATTQQVMDEAVRSVISELPEQALRELEAEETDSGSGVTITNKRILRAYKDGVVARRLNSLLRSRLVEEKNTFEAHAWKPAWYVLATKAYVVPSGGTVITVSYPTVTVTDSTVSGVSELLLDLFIQKCALLLVQRMMVEDRDALGLSVTVPSAPAAPSVPAISYSAASQVSPSVVTIAALPAAPSFIPPSLAAKPAAVTIGTLDLTKKVDGVTTLTTPTAPGAPSFVYGDAVADLMSGTSIGTLPSVPEFPSVLFEGDFSIPTIPTLDLTKKADGVTTNTLPTPPTAPVLTSAGLTGVTIGSLGTAPTFTKGVSPDFSQWQTYEDAEDPGMMLRHAEKIGLELQDLNKKVQEEQASMQAEIETYRATVQNAIQQAQITMQENVAAMNATDRLAVENYTSSLAQYDRALGEFSTEANRVKTKWDADYQKAVAPWMEQQRLYAQKYEAAVRMASDEFRGKMEDHALESQKIIEAARHLLQEAQQNAQLTTNVSLQNALQQTATQIQEHQADQQLFAQKANLYGLEVNAVVQQFTGKLTQQIRYYEAEGALDVQRHQSEMRASEGRFQADMAVYQATIERNSLAAQIQRQEAQQIAAQSTEVAVVNAARTLEAAATQYQSLIAKHSEEVRSYGTQVEAAIAKFRADNEARTGRLRAMNYDMRRISDGYYKMRNDYMRFNWPHRSFVIKQHAI